MKKKKTLLSSNRLFPILLCIATLFMLIGYASVNSVILGINGTANAKAQQGVFITSIEFANTENTTADIINSKVKSSTKTLVNSNLILSDTDANSNITLKITVYNSSDVRNAFVGYLYGVDAYSNENIIFTITGIEEEEIINPSEEKEFYVTFSYKNNVIPDNNVLDSVIDFQFKKVYDVTYTNFEESGYPNYVYDGIEKEIILPKKYQIINIYYQNGSQLIKDVEYKYEKYDTDNVLKLLDVKGNIEIKNLSTFCSKESSLADCLITTDYGSNDLVNAKKNIENKVADFSIIEPSMSYSENIKEGIVSSSIARVNTNTGIYYSTSAPTFDSVTGYHTITNGDYATIDNLISQVDGVKYYTCLNQSKSCENVYVIYETTPYSSTVINITKADKYTYTINDGFSSNSGLYAAEDDYTSITGNKSYYYRGDIKNNWVRFGDFLWRIVRINGDGSIRMIYSGLSSSTDHTGSNATIVNSKHSSVTTYGYTTSFTTTYNTEYSNGEFGSTYVGYMYNPKKVLLTSPDIPVSSSMNLDRFPTFGTIDTNAEYYFFKNFNMLQDCDTGNDLTEEGTCTLSCGKLGDDCIKAKWSSLYNNENFLDKTIEHGATDQIALYTNSSKYTCWNYSQVVEIDNGDGTKSVKVSCPIVSEIIGAFKYSSTEAKIKLHGLFSENKEASESNIIDNNIKYEIDYWYENNILRGTDSVGNLLESYLSDQVFCNDRSTTSNGFSFTDWRAISYGPNTRNFDTKTPSLKCTNSINDGFTLRSSETLSTVVPNSTIDGNNMLKYPVGTITTDEIALAGGTNNMVNNKYYLYTGTRYWTMSPHDFTPWHLHSGVACVGDDGSIGAMSTGNSHGIRPVINLKSDVLYSSGSGTESDPYVLSIK